VESGANYLCIRAPRGREPTSPPRPEADQPRCGSILHARRRPHREGDAPGGAELRKGLRGPDEPRRFDPGSGAGSSARAGRRAPRRSTGSWHDGPRGRHHERRGRACLRIGGSRRVGSTRVPEPARLDRDHERPRRTAGSAARIATRRRRPYRCPGAHRPRDDSADGHRADLRRGSPPDGHPGGATAARAGAYGRLDRRRRRRGGGRQSRVGRSAEAAAQRPTRRTATLSRRADAAGGHGLPGTRLHPGSARLGGGGFGAYAAAATSVLARRQDLALVRLVSGQPRDLRRILLGEGVVVGLFGALCGIPTGWLIGRLLDQPIGTSATVALRMAVDATPAPFPGSTQRWVSRSAC
jgi:hypothetical protein